ncbi:MAG: hypothetical protein ACI9AU_001087 [Bacteroidia bacterium]
MRIKIALYFFIGLCTFWSCKTRNTSNPSEQIDTFEIAQQIVKRDILGLQPNDSNVILDNSAFVYYENSQYSDSLILAWVDVQKESYIDVNFDGFKDIKVLNHYKSGTGGDFYDVFIYGLDSKKYIYSEFLSGNIVNINPKTKTITTYWKAGVSINMDRIVHYNNDRGIALIEETTREVKSEDSKSILITTYVRRIASESLAFRSDTTEFEGY